MTSLSQTGLLFEREQFRMGRLQVYNWGTFNELHDIPIADQGFLFVGRSGAGKSTLLDALAALLVPPQWVDFNAAAREAERSGRDRNLVSYVRGAWAEQKDGDSGEIGTRYLRAGSTWSALALTYRDALGRSVTLVRLFWIHGGGNGTDAVRKQQMIFEREFDLQELEFFGRENYDLRKLRQVFANDFIRDEFRPYSERFCHLLGIESDMALRLLHKTQSAKNLGDLNSFLRDFMLDKPQTFEAADRLVAEFGELNAAHQAVVTAREQVQTLQPARTAHQNRQNLETEYSRLAEQDGNLDHYTQSHRIDLTREQLAALRIKAEGLEGECSQRETAAQGLQHNLIDLQQQHRNQGGGQIEQWRTQQLGLEQQRDDRLRKRTQAESACRGLGYSLAATPQGFAEQVGDARTELEQMQSTVAQQRESLKALTLEQHAIEQEMGLVRREIDVLTRQPSNIPAHMLDLRDSIAQRLGIAAQALPFVGELLQVKDSESSWQGAIERVLHGFALSVLVDERHYPALSTHVDANWLNGRLVYLKAGRTEAGRAQPMATTALPFKLDVKPGTFADWLQAELRQRFDYACVESAQALRTAERGVTREGQVRHGKVRHEKDDRHRLDDRSRWVLGFDNQAKLALFKSRFQTLAEQLSGLTSQLQTLGELQQTQSARSLHCQTLINLTWQDIDAASLLDRIASLQRQIQQAQAGNQHLQQLAESIRQASEALRDAEQALLAIKVQHDKVIDQARDLALRLDQWPEPLRLSPEQHTSLDERFAQLGTPLTLGNLDTLSRSVQRQLNDEKLRLTEEIAEYAHIVVNQFSEFKRRWPMEASDLDASLASADEFLLKLIRLEADGLPAHEQRFFELLHDQSQQNLANLHKYLSLAQQAIRDRMELVNESLSEVPFNQGADQPTFLQIDVSDRQLPAVREFKQALQQIQSYAWVEDRAVAEERFLVLRSLVERLASQDNEDRRWRELALDVRQHVEFIGRESDAEGNEIEVYRSGAGKSGGQRQKLATTCLAAALRYQLGGQERGVPMYAPVVLDEAFDKADNEFTALAMNIFTNFGFQMIVATPLKSVMTLEPFIGGACFVDIADRRRSGVLLIEYDTASQRLQLSDAMREAPDDETP